MTDAADKIAEARALIEPLTGYTPGDWRILDETDCHCDEDGNVVSMAIGKRDYHAFALAMHGYSVRIVEANAALIAAAPALRDTVAALTDLADALAQENAKLREAMREIRQCTSEHQGAARALKIINSALGETP